MMAGVGFISLVATSLTFGTAGFSILSVNRALGLLLLILTFDLPVSSTPRAGLPAEDERAVLATADFAAVFFAGSALGEALPACFAKVVFLTAADAFFATGAFASDRAVCLEPGFATALGPDLAAVVLVPIFTVALTDLAAGFSVSDAFLASFVATRFKVDEAVFPATFVLVILVGLATVLPGFFTVTVFLADFVTVAFMSSVLDELSNTRISSGAERDFYCHDRYGHLPPFVKPR